MNLDGVVVVDKPAGMTSHDVIDEIRRRLGTKRVGHAGTLDPDATGVLVVGVGRATRFLSYAQAAPKRYTAVARLGVTTSTQDASGEKLEVRPARVGRDDVVRALGALTGDIDQIPPMVSAVKVRGERLYEKARRGEDVDRPARRVTVHELNLMSFGDGDHPIAELDVRCSAGTYVRTLVHDLGALLGCGAHVESLRRTDAGGFSIADAVVPEDVDPGVLRPMIDAVAVLPRVDVDDDAARAVRDGRTLPGVPDLADGRSVALAAGGELVGVYRNEGGRLVPERVVGR